MCTRSIDPAMTCAREPFVAEINQSTGSQHRKSTGACYFLLTCIFAKTVDCQSRLSSNLFLIARRQGGRESYASRGRRPGVSGADGANGAAASGRDLESMDNPMFPFCLSCARGAFVVVPFPLEGATETLERDISCLVRYTFKP
jgi:hypothetical protein